MLVPLSTPDAAVLNRVGGKATSLIRLQQAGLEVPHGLVLTTRFFEPWLTEVQATSEWLSVLEVLQVNGSRQPNLQQRAELSQACERVKSLAFSLPVNANQRALIDAIDPDLGTGSYAVRSSSPEEDMAGASFAGLYETVLGADTTSLTDAICTCFFLVSRRARLVVQIRDAYGEFRTKDCRGGAAFRGQRRCMRSVFTQLSHQ